MRRWLLGGAVVAAAAVLALLTIERAPPPAAVSASPEPASPPPAPPSEPPLADAPPPQPPPDPAPPDPPPPQEASTPPSPPALPPLPEQDVSSLPVHPVPDYRTAPVPHVTMEDRSGNPIARPPAPPVSAAPASSPPAEPPARVEKGRASPPLQQAALPPSLSGPAQATGTVMLALQGHSVRLFGIAAPASADRCLLGSGDPRPCAEVAEQVLAARLAHSATVTCALPSGGSAGHPTRVCLDDKGVDIAGFLVGEGLALGDPKQSSNYRSAEGVARSLRKGLWAYR